MKAAVLKQILPDNLEQSFAIEDIPQPEITSDEDVIVRLKSASLNHRDLWIAQGQYSKIKMPAVLGSDGSGMIYEKGSKVKNFKEGDEVIINPNINWGDNENFQGRNYSILGMPSQGTLAEYIKVKSDRLILKPEFLDHDQAAALPLAGLTAFRAVFKKGKAAGDKNILITGTGGGVAAFILLFAVSCGARVFVTSGSDAKISRAVELGAAGGVNYKDPDWDKKISELSENTIDLIFDGTGGDTVNKCLEVINYGGKIVVYGATIGRVKELNIHRIFWKQVSITGSTMGSDNDFKEMIEYVEMKKIEPVIDSVFDLDNISGAFERISEAEQFGKVIVQIK